MRTPSFSKSDSLSFPKIKHKRYWKAYSTLQLVQNHSIHFLLRGTLVMNSLNKFQNHSIHFKINLWLNQLLLVFTIFLYNSFSQPAKLCLGLLRRSTIQNGRYIPSSIHLFFFIILFCLCCMSLLILHYNS